MSWTETDLTGVSTEMELIPAGVYVFELLPGAKPGRFDAQKIELGAKIAEGEYAGRVQYFSYGNPEKVPSMLHAFKRLEVALSTNKGVAIEPGEDPVLYLNRAEVVGGKFIAKLVHRDKPETEDRPAQTVSDINIFSVKPVPEA